MESILTVSLALAAGFHAALYGAWKDSPSEDFRPRRFAREVIIAGTAGVVLCQVDHLCSPLILYLSAFTISRIATEFYKLFLRRERQDGFRIPTQVHLARHVVANPVLRALLGVGWLGAIYGLYALLRLLPDDTPPYVVGPVTGLVFGTALAIGGGYKDGSIEGVDLHKFLKSPIAAAIGGYLVSFHTASLEFIVLGTLALERMFNELVFKLLTPGYVPGKFPMSEPPYPCWLRLRSWFLVPYAATWLLAVGLWFWPE